MTYRLTAQTVADIDEIVNFIAVQMGNPHGAEVVPDYLFEIFERIGTDPEGCGGKLRPNITDKPVELLYVGKYAIVFDDGYRPPVIIAVVGNRRNLAELLATEPRFDQSKR